MSRRLLFLLSFILFTIRLPAQDAAGLIQTVREKLEKINDYQADAELKTHIPFLRVPDAAVVVYYKKTGRIQIKNEQGISLVPKETVSLSLYGLLNGRYQVIDAGSDKQNGIPVRVVKLLPENENADLVLATLYIDPARGLVLKASITGRENGTDEVIMSYGHYASSALPDKIVFSFNTRDYKLPKGITFDYDDGSQKKNPAPDQKNQRGNIELIFHSYLINRGLKEDVFK